MPTKYAQMISALNAIPLFCSKNVPKTTPLGIFLPSNQAAGVAAMREQPSQNSRKPRQPIHSPTSNAPAEILNTKDATGINDLKEVERPELDLLLKADKFNHFRPISCAKCDSSAALTRRIFTYSQTAKDLPIEAFQETIRLQLNKLYSISAVHFKTANKRLYIDSSLCSACGSTWIRYLNQPRQNIIQQKHS